MVGVRLCLGVLCVCFARPAGGRQAFHTWLVHGHDRSSADIYFRVWWMQPLPTLSRSARAEPRSYRQPCHERQMRQRACYRATSARHDAPHHARCAEKRAPAAATPLPLTTCPRQPTLLPTQALTVAAHGGHVKCVARLLMHRADASLCASDGCSPLYLAARRGNTRVVQQLIAANALVEDARRLRDRILQNLWPPLEWL